MKTDSELMRLAEQEVDAEIERKRIDAYKEQIRTRRSFWHKIFPFKITIERR
jgi:hypothetical protein